MERKREAATHTAEGLQEEGIVQRWRERFGEDTEALEQEFSVILEGEDPVEREALLRAVDTLKTLFPALPSESWSNPQLLRNEFLRGGYPTFEEALDNYRALLRFLVFVVWLERWRRARMRGRLRRGNIAREFAHASGTVRGRLLPRQEGDDERFVRCLLARYTRMPGRKSEREPYTLVTDVLRLLDRLEHGWNPTREDWYLITQLIGKEKVKEWERRRQIPSPEQLREQVEEALNERLKTEPYRAIVVHRRRDGRIIPEVRPSVRSFEEVVVVPRRWCQPEQEPASTQERGELLERKEERSIAECVVSSATSRIPEASVGAALATFLRRTLPPSLREHMILNRKQEERMQEWAAMLARVIVQPLPLVSWVRWGRDDFIERLSQDLSAQATLWGFVFLLQAKENAPDASSRLRSAITPKEQEWLMKVWEKKGRAIAQLLSYEEA